jgi:glycosyltransferase involved in cell wall biosynthesis
MKVFNLKRLAIITTHPIQYNAPLFQLLQQRGNVMVKVFYTWGKKVMEEKHDPGFGKSIQWDIPLLDGYDYEFAENIAKDPGSHHFKGIDNPGLIQSIKDWGADAVLVYGWAFKSHLKAIRSFKGKIPVYFRGDSTLLDKVSNLKKIVRSVFLRWVYCHIDVALYVGTENKKYFEALGLKPFQLIFAPHAVDNERFSKDQNRENIDALRWKENLNIYGSDIVFLFAGKLESKKNHKLLADFFCSKVPKNYHLIVAGSGPLEDELKLKFAGQKNIHFLDFVNQAGMPLLYRLADVFVLPSKGPGETWGLSINEAMASGKAILASSACGAATDLVKDGQNGFVFLSNDKDDLELKMKLITENTNTLAEMGAESAKIIKEWTFGKDCDAIEKIIKDL